MIHRFHSRRPLTADMSNITTFQLEISNRTEGSQEVWRCLESLSGSAALQLIGLQLRRESLKQSPAAEWVQKLQQELFY